MRPTHINIIGKSKFKFTQTVASDILEHNRFSDLILRIDPGAIIVLSDRVISSVDVEPLIKHLKRFGIPKTEIWIRYPETPAQELVSLKLRGGLTQSGLGFGADVAEHDSGLRRYFISTQSYASIQSHEKHLVIGPKGSGKSAILRELVSLSSQRNDSLVITPEHYATDILEALVKNEIGTGLAAYITTWKYTLLIEIFRRLVQNGIGDKSSLNEIRKYLIEHHHFDDNLTLFERFLGYLRRITQIKGKIGPAEAELGLEGSRELEKLFKMDELLGLIPALRRVIRRTPFTVFIDELDQSWNNSETANTFLVSLLTAAIQLRGIDENLHVVVFLRSEIFDLLKPTIPQLDKLRSDIEPISWSSRELTKLIVSRALDSIKIDVERVAADAVIATLFPGVMPPSGVPTFEYILSRTSYRPREVIQFCNLALKVARQIELSATLQEAVQRADEEFSTWKLEYIVSENLFIYPRLDTLLERFRGMARRLTSEALDSTLTEILLGAESDKEMPNWVREVQEPERLLQLLYKLEVIGIEKLESHYVEGRLWESYDFVFTRPKGKPEQSASFLFHPGLWKTLELI